MADRARVLEVALTPAGRGRARVAHELLRSLEPDDGTWALGNIKATAAKRALERLGRRSPGRQSSRSGCRRAEPLARHESQTTAPDPV